MLPVVEDLQVSLSLVHGRHLLYERFSVCRKLIVAEAMLIRLHDLRWRLNDVLHLQLLVEELEVV